MRTLALLAAWLAAFPAGGAVFTSELVASLPPAGGVSFDSDPSAGVQMGGFFYFVASDGPNGTTGRELWKTDDTPAGTTLVRNIRPAAADSSPRFLRVVGNTLFFAADDGVHGEELWKSDGTTNGTMLVKDIRLGSAGSSMLQLTPVGTALFFSADDGANGRELWKSDGTPGGTAMVSDINPGTNSTTIFQIEAAGSLAYFSARFGGSGPLSLFKSDGTAGGTVRLAGPGGLVTGSTISGFEAFGSEALFVSTDTSTNDSLWRTDGTTGGSAHLQTVAGRVNEFRLFETQCYFTTPHSLTFSNPFTHEVTRYDYEIVHRRTISPGGTSEVVDSSDAFSETTYDFLTVANSRLYYISKRYSLTAFSSTLKSVANGGAPVTIDSTTDTTSPGDSTFEILGAVGAVVAYVDDNDRQKILTTDGASTGAPAVNFQALGISRVELLLSGSRIFFTGGTTNTGTEIGVTDLTPAGTQILGDVRPGSASSGPTFLGLRGNSVIFSANDGLIGEELWRSDGTSNGTLLLKDIAPGTDSPPPVATAVVSGTLFLSVETPNLGRELWKSDGTEAGTALVKDIRPGTNGSAPANLTAWNGILYFTASDGTNGVELWRSDGTESGTFMLKNVRVGPAGSDPEQLAAAGVLLFFVADDGAHGAELWRSDGTAEGTYMAHDIVPGVDPAAIAGLSAVGNTVYFVADSGSAGRGLWFSDGQPGGTQFLKDLGPGDSFVEVQNFTGFAGAVYLQVQSGFTPGLWRTDGTPGGTGLIKTDIGAHLSASSHMLFASGGTRLWVSDGTAAGTVTLKDIGKLIGGFAAAGSNLYFTAREDLWISDGTSNGTVMVADFPDPAPVLDYPQELTEFLGALLFTAKTPTYGRELWTAAPGYAPTMIEDLDPGAADADIRFLNPAVDKVFYIARPSGQPAWQVRALRMQSGTNPQRGWTGAPAAVPGRIQAEHFDHGGEGVAYHDTTIANEGGQFRVSDAVDIEVCEDAGGGFCLMRTRPGEWLEYTFEAKIAGYYRIDTRAVSSTFGARFHLSVDDVAVGGVNNVPLTWTNVSVPDVPLTTGVHVLRLTFDNTNNVGDAGRINWIEFTATPNQPPVITIDSPLSGAIYAPGEIVSVAATIEDTTTTQPPQVEFFIDGQSLGIGGNRRSWLATPGPHVLRVRATDSFGASATSVGRLFFVTPPTLPYGSEWRYEDQGRNLGVAWRLPGYDDSRWPSGPAELGFGDADEATVIDGGTVSAPHTTVYFRRTLPLNLAGITHASVSLRRDDGAVLYINGQEIAARNLPKPPAVITYSTLAQTNTGTALGRDPDFALDVIPVPLSALSNGMNVLAVEIHQAPGNQPSLFDLSFDLALSLFDYRSGAVLTIDTKDGRVAVRWPDYLTDWELEQSTDLLNWTPFTDRISTLGGFFVATPPVSPHGFFRLRQVY